MSAGKIPIENLQCFQVGETVDRDCGNQSCLNMREKDLRIENASRGSQKFIDKHFPYLQLTPEPHRMFQIAQLENIKILTVLN